MVLSWRPYITSSVNYTPHHFLQDCSDVKAVVGEIRRLELYVIDVDTLQAYLVVDKNVVDEVSIIDIPFILMSAFFVYNICYPKGCNNFYSFLEIVVLNHSAENASPTVKHLLSKINVH